MTRSSSAGGNLVYKLLKESGIEGLISGGIFKGDQADDSLKEDVIVRPATIRNGSKQLQYVDILLFVPDVQIGDNHWMGDYGRIEELSGIIVNTFDYVADNAFTLTFEENVTQKDDSKKQHYSFFRLLIRFYTIVDTNI